MTKTLAIAYTKADRATQPGGVILRELPSGELAAHHFNRDLRSLEPKEFFWGHYGEAARGAYADKLDRSLPFTISEADIHKEIVCID